MKNGMRKDLWREIRRSMGRFLSLLLIVALGVGFFVGVKATAPSMKYSASLFFEEQNLHDFHLLSDYGFVDADLNALQEVSGVESVMPGYSADLIVRLEGRNRVMRVLSMPMNTIRNTEVIDAPYLVEGRLPEAKDECVVEVNQIIPDSIQIGDVITVEAPDDTTELSALVNQSTFTVVGLVESPMYISVKRGITTVGDGTIAGYMLVNPEAFAYTRYTDVYLQTDASFDPKNVFAAPYFDEIKVQSEKLKVIGQQRLIANREDIQAQGQEEIAKQTLLLKDALANGLAELNQGQKALDEGAAALAQSQADVEQAKIQLAQAQKDVLNNQASLQQAQLDLNAARQNYKQQLLDGQAKIDDGWTQYDAGIVSYNQGVKDYEAGLAKYNEGLSQYNTALNDYNAGLAKYNAAYADYQDGLNQYNQGLAQYNAQKAALDQKRADLEAAKAQLADLQQGINLLQALYDLMVATPDAPLVPTIYLIQQAIVNGGNFSASQQAWFDNEITYIVDNAGANATFGSAAPLVSGRIAMYQQQYNEGQAQVAAAQKQIDDGQAQLDAAKVKLDDSKKTLDASKAQLDDTKAQLDAAKAKLDQTKAQLDASKKQLDESKAQLDASQVKLANTKKQLEASQVSLARQKTDGAANLDAAQRKIDDGWIQLENAKEQIALNQKKIVAGEQTLVQAQKDYDAKVLEFADAKKQYDAEAASGKQQLLDAQKELDSLELGKWYIFTRNDTPGFADFADDASRIGGIADVFPVFFFIVAALVCLTTMTRMVEENRTQSGTLKALGYSDWAISSKYFYYALLATLIGCVLGGIIGINLFPKAIFGAYSDMYTLPRFAIAISVPTFAVALLGAFLSTCTVALFVAYRELREEPAQLMRPKAPKAGKRIFLERIPLIWNRFSFSSKVTARNLIRYKSRFIMTVFGVAGCTALILSAYGLQNAVGVIVPQQFGVIQNFDTTLSARYGGKADEKAAFMEVLKGDSRVGDALLTRQETLYTQLNSGKILDVNLVVPQWVNTFNAFYTLHDAKGNPVRMEANSVIITDKMAEMGNLQIGDTLTLYNDASSFEVAITDIVKNYVFHYAYIAPELYQKTIQSEVSYNTSLVQFVDPGMIDRDAFAQEWLERSDVLVVFFNQTAIDSFKDVIQSMNAVTLVMILSAAALAIIVLYNLTNINIAERLREIATIKVLGFSDGESSNYVYRENLVLTLLGIGLGLFMGVFLARYLISSVEIDMVRFGREIFWQSFALAAGLTFLFAIVVNLLMYRKINRISMVESLKSVE